MHYVYCLTPDWVTAAVRFIPTFFKQDKRFKAPLNNLPQETEHLYSETPLSSSATNKPVIKGEVRFIWIAWYKVFLSCMKCLKLKIIPTDKTELWVVANMQTRGNQIEDVNLKEVSLYSYPKVPCSNPYKLCPRLDTVITNCNTSELDNMTFMRCNATTHGYVHWYTHLHTLSHFTLTFTSKRKPTKVPHKVHGMVFFSCFFSTKKSRKKKNKQHMHY